MKAEGRDVICTRVCRYRVSAEEQAHLAAARYAGLHTDHAQEQQVRAQWQLRGATCYHVRLLTRSGGYFFVNGTEMIIFWFRSSSARVKSWSRRIARRGSCLPR